MTEVPPDNVLDTHSTPGFVVVIGAEAQEQARLPLDVVRLLSEENRTALRTSGDPAWYRPETVRDEVMKLRDCAQGSDRAAVEAVWDLVEYACSTGTGVATVPPPST